MQVVRIVLRGCKKSQEPVILVASFAPSSRMIGNGCLAALRQAFSSGPTWKAHPVRRIPPGQVRDAGLCLDPAAAVRVNKD